MHGATMKAIAYHSRSF